MGEDGGDEIEQFVQAVNASAKHQQDLIQSDKGVARTIAPGTHASGPHLTKTLVEQKQVGVDLYNTSISGEVNPTLTSACGGVKSGGQILEKAYGVDQQGGKGGANYTEDVAPTLASNSHGTPHGVCYGFEPGASQRLSPRFSEEKAPTLRVQMGDNQASVVYGICSFDSNSMKSKNPNSGIYEAETSRTLDLNGGSPACNQGGMVVAQPQPDEKVNQIASTLMSTYSRNYNGNAGAFNGENFVFEKQNYGVISKGNGETILSPEKHMALSTGGGQAGQGYPCAMVCIEGNGSRPSHKGDGYKETDIQYTLNATEQHGVCYRKQSHAKSKDDGQGWQETDVHDTLNTFDSGESRTPTLVVDNPEAVQYTVRDCITPKIGNGDVSNTLLARDHKEPMSICNNNYVLRRLTPLECTRLQGFPDHWVDIGDWVDSKGKKHKDSDSNKYRALGNSIALPFWEWLGKKIVEEDPSVKTMASLFDGIGGFPLSFMRAGCVPVWSSEIEEFPMAVTRIRFGED